jgi:hypothetical protein
VYTSMCYNFVKYYTLSIWKRSKPSDISESRLLFRAKARSAVLRYHGLKPVVSRNRSFWLIISVKDWEIPHSSTLLFMPFEMHLRWIRSGWQVFFGVLGGRKQRRFNWHFIRKKDSGESPLLPSPLPHLTECHPEWIHLSHLYNTYWWKVDERGNSQNYTDFFGICQTATR